MKKLLSLLLAVTMLLTLTACNLSKEPPADDTTKQPSDSSDVSVTPTPNPSDDTTIVDLPDSLSEAVDAVLLEVYEQDGTTYLVYCDAVVEIYEEKYVSSLKKGDKISTSYDKITVETVTESNTGVIINDEYVFFKLSDGTYTLNINGMPYFTKGEEHTVPVSESLTITDMGFSCECSDLQTMFDTHYKDHPESINEEFFVSLTIENEKATAIMRMDF